MSQAKQGVQPVFWLDVGAHALHVDDIVEALGGKTTALKHAASACIDRPAVGDGTALLCDQYPFLFRLGSVDDTKDRRLVRLHQVFAPPSTDVWTTQEKLDSLRDANVAEALRAPEKGILDAQLESAGGVDVCELLNHLRNDGFPVSLPVTYALDSFEFGEWLDPRDYAVAATCSSSEPTDTRTRILSDIRCVELPLQLHKAGRSAPLPQKEKEGKRQRAPDSADDRTISEATRKRMKKLQSALASRFKKTGDSEAVQQPAAPRGEDVDRTAASLPPQPSRAVLPSERRVVVIPLYSTWYSPGIVHPIEREEVPLIAGKNYSQLVPLDSCYVDTRDWIVRCYRATPGAYLSFTGFRRAASGDIFKLQVIFRFLEKWGLINYQLDAAGHASEVSPAIPTAEDELPTLKVPISADQTGSTTPDVLDDDIGILHAVQFLRTPESFGEELGAYAKHQVPRRSAKECMIRYVALKLVLDNNLGEDTPRKEAPDGSSALQRLVARTQLFLEECAPRSVVDRTLLALSSSDTASETSTCTVSQLASAALGIVQAKAALMVEEERALVRALLRRALNLQVAKINHLLGDISFLRKDSEYALEALPSQWVTMYTEHYRTRVRLIQLSEYHSDSPASGDDQGDAANSPRQGAPLSYAPALQKEG